MEKIRSMKFTMAGTYGIISALMIFIFGAVYGIHILNPTYTDWLLSGGDLSQHYLGWKAYRLSGWTFPIGCTDYLAYPNKTSIIFTDSIPIFAVLFKILSLILPKEFQYFGLWGILCFILQGILAARIISKFTDNNSLLILVSVLFSMTPIMLWRMYVHTALAAHWILLLALEPIFVYNKYRDNNRIIFSFGGVGVLAASIHLYYILMCGIILMGFCVRDILESKKIKRSLGVLVTFLLSASVTVGILGGFAGGISALAPGLGRYSMNLNAIFNPQDWSCIYQTRALYGDGQYEGFAYLGAGCILALMISGLTIIGNEKEKEILRNHRFELISIAIVSIMSFAIALSPVITIGGNVICELDLPVTIMKVWSVFRASGRIIWVFVYIIMLCCCIALIKLFNKRSVIIILMLCIALQIYDIHNMLFDINRKYNQVVEKESPLKNSLFWNMIGENEDIENVILVQLMATANETYAFTDWALTNNKTINRFYFARLQNFDDDYPLKLLAEPSETEIFVFCETNKEQCLNFSLYYYLVDGYIIGYSKPINGMNEISGNYFLQR